MAARRTSFVYFIVNHTARSVKIGFTRGVVRRLRDLQAANSDKLTLIKTIEGTKLDEVSIHRRFKDTRIHGEWFKLTPDLIDFIDSL